jgi:hypothetical protein
VANSLAAQVDAAIASLGTAPASSLVNLTNFVGIVDSNPGAFNNATRNVSGEMVGRAESAAYIIRKLTGAQTFDLMIGDNDGYGDEVPDNGNFTFAPPSGYLFTDRRSPSEKAATDGSEHTDVYSTFDWFTVPSAPLTTWFDVEFDVEGTLQSATLEIDMGGFQAATWGPITVAFNGVTQPNLLYFEDGANATRVRQFVLSPAAIANANAEGHFRVTFTNGTSNDGMAFDYFRLTGTALP